MNLLTLHLDEAGRGPLAGPVSVGCCLDLSRFKKSIFVDSKIINESRREHLYSTILELEKKGKICFGSGFASNKDIDDFGIIPSLQKAGLLAMFMSLKKYYSTHRSPALQASKHKKDKMAYTQLAKLFRKRKITLSVLQEIVGIPNSIAKIDKLLIDGNHTFGLDLIHDLTVITIIKGDSKNSMISMASIVAKVERDRWMVKCAKKFPDYGFDGHKGYGTVKHRTAIARYGVSSLHRKTFCGNIVVKKNNS